MKQLQELNTPTILTLIRLICSPILLPLGFVLLLPYNNQIFNILLALFFLLLSLTDFLDGYLARKYNQITFLGKTLDPLADKLLLLSALISLLVTQKIFFYWVIIFLGREFFIMGLRILALEQGFDIPVGWLGKVKTVMQILYIACAIVTHQNSSLFFIYLEYVLLFSALILSLLSAYSYYRTFMKQLLK